MNNLPNDQFNTNYAGEIDLSDMLNALWEKKYSISLIIFIFVLSSIFYAVNQPNIYKSEAILIPVESDTGMGGMLGEYSGMAALAGISLPDDASSKSKEAIARIKSYDFFSEQLLPYIKLEDIFAVKKWDATSNKNIYDERIFDTKSRKWVRKVRSPRSTIPSSQEAYEEYIDILTISQDKITSFVSLSIEHESPYLAQRWVRLIIDQIDKVMRNEARNEATKSVEYLNSLRPTVNYDEIRDAISSLQQEEMKRLMMVEANENYIFKVIDSPLIPEIKFKPKRSLIVMLGLILGIIISVLSFLIPYFRKISDAE